MLARIEAMGVKSRFIELRETRHREERERKEAKLQVRTQTPARRNQVAWEKQCLCASVSPVSGADSRETSLFLPFAQALNGHGSSNAQKDLVQETPKTPSAATGTRRKAADSEVL